MPGFPNHASRRVLERFTWIAAAILLLGSLAFLGVAGEVMEGDTLRLEERSLMAMRVPGDPSRPVGPAWLKEAFRDFTGLGGVGVLGLLTAATLGYLWRQGGGGRPCTWSWPSLAVCCSA